MSEEQQAVLKDLEEKIRGGDDAGIRFRWESGKQLLKLRGAKQRLSGGERMVLVQQLGLPASELTARMKFATKFSDDQLANLISQHRNWFAIKQKALTDRPRPKNKAADDVVVDDLRDVHATLAKLNPADLAVGAVALLGKIAKLATSLHNGAVGSQAERAAGTPAAA